MRNKDVQAVVYFEDEELSVLDRNSRIEPFQTSPYSRMLESCTVYLDESHTRGTDLRLPRNYRAALTLGSQVTKDRPMQAAMRMKKLGNGQAVTFIVPEDIRAKIYATTSEKPSVSIEKSDGFSQRSNPKIAEIVTRCRDFGATSHDCVPFAKEQERELAPEIEEERQIERPPLMKAPTSTIHKDLGKLVEIGNLLPVSDAWQPAFQALRMTRAGGLVDLNDFPKDLLVTKDFMKTVLIPSGTCRAGFSVPDPSNCDMINNLMVISPKEANSVMSKIRLDAKVTLHVFAARASISFACLDNLTFYIFNLFAGSLYLNSFSKYSELCDHLGLLQGTAQEGQVAHADGFIDPPVGKWGLKTSPVHFLRAFLMKTRREGEGVEKTHLGRIRSGGRQGMWIR
ncbi:hypothetical protein Ptr902_01887 [Pyrenophora tritici-repentis]|uniref:ubiquitinyl hydrolase 1 n=1 Tax=Pyrenophora tritici-repentis TaxID=45151 RepID=A0A2W1E3J5_9PLEO|nr:hypothetical protein PtrV1_01005 [Pyrenophora tritici-repentis]KAF7453724.1 hypothetical protein A1F99_009820 [Pyrenophora tritici-repentis]KAI0581178.1 hypothetical protein Alg215_04794 [Pyrenophora tritici-repentis]KAI0621693.1 hypothetical protein TUN199_06330 [Pyrenophora tritici-repentis]KAI1520601.1 hypothetical protein Ptr86124_000969 [Pyrenophora tritici-repentis]